MALSRGLWIGYSVVLFPALAIVTAIFGAVVLRIMTNTTDNRYYVLLIPFLSLMAVSGGILALDNTVSVWFWYFTGESVVAGASVSFGIVYKQQNRLNRIFSAILIIVEIVVATVLCSVGIGWILALGAIESVFGITAGFVLAQPRVEPVT